ELIVSPLLVLFPVRVRVPDPVLVTVPPVMVPLITVLPLPPTVSPNPVPVTAPLTVSVPVPLFAQVWLAPRASGALIVWLALVATVIPPAPSWRVVTLVGVGSIRNAPAVALNVSEAAPKFPPPVDCSRSLTVLVLVVPASTRRVFVR